MKSKSLSIVSALLLLFVVAIFISCEKQLASTSSDPQIYDPSVELDVKLAKKYYKILKAEEGDKVTSKSTTTLSDSRPNRKYLLFKKAYTSSTKKASFVEVPLFYNKRPASMMGYKTEFDKPKANKALNSSFDRLLIYKDKKSGKVDQRIITYFPDENYLARHNNDVSHNQINKLDPDFSGKIVYKSWDGVPLFAFKIINGKRVKTFSKSKRKSGKKKTKNSTLTEYCETYFYAEYERWCYSSDPEGYDEVCTDWEMTYYEEWTECYDDGLTGDDCIDYGIGCYEDPLPEPDPCESSTTYSVNGARVMSECPPVDIKYDDLADKPCAAALIKSLENIPGFADLINHYQSNHGTFNLHWGHEAYSWNGPYEGGRTQYDWNGTNSDVTINLNTHMLDESSDLVIAGMAIHEAFHAYLASIYNYGKDKNSPDYLNYEQLVVKYGSDNASANVPSHIFIANKVTEMASILSAWDHGSITDDPSYYAKICIAGISPNGNQSVIDQLNSVKSALGLTDAQINYAKMAEIASAGLQKGEKLGSDCPNP